MRSPSKTSNLSATSEGSCNLRARHRISSLLPKEIVKAFICSMRFKASNLFPTSKGNRQTFIYSMRPSLFATSEGNRYKQGNRTTTIPEPYKCSISALQCVTLSTKFSKRELLSILSKDLHPSSRDLVWIRVYENLPPIVRFFWSRQVLLSVSHGFL